MPVSEHNAKAVSDANMIKLAIFAVGGQGGGVLSNWIVAVAEANGYLAQSTSVAGVAQRTGATIYYVELTPDLGKQPIFSLSPVQGDIDIMITAEMMEAGRAVSRGFVTPQQTTLITSTHRILSVAEKTVPGDGIRASAPVEDTVRKASAKYIGFDMERVAHDARSIISSSLFGALAGSGSLPFSRESFETAIRNSGRGIETSLQAFDVAYRLAQSGGLAPEANQARQPTELPALKTPRGPKHLLDSWQLLTQRLHKLPDNVMPTAHAGVIKVIDCLDPEYANEYLDRLERVLSVDSVEQDWTLTLAAAKHIANAMTYDDPIRVADWKTRRSRGQRIKGEAGAGDEAIIHLTEYFHPRLAEVCDCLPTGIAKWVENRPRLSAWLDKRIDKGRRIRSDSIWGFTTLWVLAALRPYRRKLKRHKHEIESLELWLSKALDLSDANYPLAVQVLNCRRLIKGYSDTHSRGTSKFDRLMASVSTIKENADAGETLSGLIELALAQESDDLLEESIKNLASVQRQQPEAQGNHFMFH